MTEILTESFCERCGTRYTFESARPKSRLKGVKVMTRGINQDGSVVIEYARSVMVWKRAFAPNRNAFPEPKLARSDAG